MVGDECVEPLENIQVARLARADDDRAVLCHNCPGAGETRRGIGEQMNALMQRRASPTGHCGTLEIVDRLEAMPLVVELNGGQKRRLVLRAAPGFARVHRAEKGVIGHDNPAQQAARFAFGHGPEQLVFDPPSGAVTAPRWRLSESAEMLLLFCVTK